MAADLECLPLSLHHQSVQSKQRVSSIQMFWVEGAMEGWGRFDRTAMCKKGPS